MSPAPAPIRTVSLPHVEVLDAAADERTGSWYVLTAGGIVHRLGPSHDAGHGETNDLGDRDATALGALVPVTRVPLIDEPFTEEVWRRPLQHRLHVAPGAAHVAVVNDYRRLGQVVSTVDRRVVFDVDGGDYHQDTVPVSFAFVARPAGRIVAVHRTSWNRLDATDASDGRLLTPRPSPQYRRPAERQGDDAHYLDYFHGRLLVSPDGRRILDDGWVWQPMSVPVVFDVGAWLTNVWETEDGPTRCSLQGREDWSRSACWVDARTVALGDIENDDGEPAPWLRLYDVDADAVRPMVSRPAPDAVELFSDGTHLAFVTAAATIVEDIAGEQVVGRYEGFAPTRYCRRTGELVEIGAHGLRIGALLDPAANSA